MMMLGLLGCSSDSCVQVLPPGILPVRGSNELLVSRVMEGKVTDWARARRAAEMIRSRDYTTKDTMAMAPWVMGSKLDGFSSSL